MKKSLLAIALAVATTPFVFAGQAKSTAPVHKTSTTVTHTKKHVRKARKTKKPAAAPTAAHK